MCVPDSKRCGKLKGDILNHGEEAAEGEKTLDGLRTG